MSEKSEQYIQDLLENIVTLSERAEVVAALQQLSMNNYASHPKEAQKKIADLLPDAFAQPIQKILQNTDQSQVSKLLTDAQAAILAVPVVSVTTPYTPTRTQLEELQHRIKQKFNKNLIISQIDNHSSKFGITIEFAGKRYTKTI